MPIYEYRCSACGGRVEAIHGYSEAGPEKCAVCGGTLERQLSTTADVRGTGAGEPPCAGGSCGCGNSPHTCSGPGCCCG